MNPADLYQGDRVKWLETNIPAEASAVKVWLRSTTAGAGLEINGTAADGGWEVVITEQATAAMVVGAWELQIVATVDGAPVTVRRGSLTVRRGLAFTGTPGTFDDRSQAEKDLADVEAAIRALATGAQEYQIGSLGNGGRKVRRADLSELLNLRDRLAAQVAQEKRAQALASGTATSRKIRVAFR
jgi:hypothetical protein